MNSPSSDRNFLFALVAYQNGYITMEQFFEAAQLWNKDPKKDIGDILVERQFLDDVERFNIQGIVEDRLRRQGGIDNSLSFVLENGSVPQGEDLPEAWQQKFTEITKISEDSSKSSGAGPKPQPSIHRYVFRRPIGEGGQGIVWEVDDTELGRRIALKKVHPKHANSPLHKGMLIEESRNTGRLDHAGIVPVYDLGQDDEGNPFFTMQLIKGEKLADRVKSIKHETLSREEFLGKIRPLLRHLIATCNTLQYAYDQFKVIHRDLKPENIMVNRYGETVVMDWGMGKAVEDATQLDQASSMLFVPVSGSGSGSGIERTRVGSVKGTLGYLSPEQAQAMNNNLDHRTDIYGLGATLYRILTGTVPYSGTSVEEALNRARLNQFVRPRERNWKIPKDLEAICLKAMATLPEDRYQKATDMGMDLENWIAGDPISVVPDNLLKKSERWLRRHARGVIASLLLLGLTAAALLWANALSLKKSYDLNIANTSLKEQQKVAKASRDALSTVLDDVVGTIFDDQMSQIPHVEKSRINMLKAAIGEMQNFVDKYPDDWDLKLDIVRLLTRLGHLQSETDPEGASETFQKTSELIARARKVPDEKIRKINWIGAAIDSEYYRADFLLEIKKDQQGATQANQVCLELVEEFDKDETGKDGNHGIISRLHSQKSLIMHRQDRLDEALIHANLGVEAMSDYFGTRFLQEEVSKDRISKIDYSDILVYIAALDQRCSVLKDLSRRQDYSKSLRDLLRCCQIAEQVPNAQRDARIYATRALGELYRIAISNHDASTAQSYYDQALEWIEKGIEDSAVVQTAMMLETDRATLLAPIDTEKAIEAISKAQDYLEELKPSESQTDDSQNLWYMSVKIHFNDAKLAVLLAQGKQQEHEQLRQEQSELEHQFELLENKLSGKETKQ